MNYFPDSSKIHKILIMGRSNIGDVCYDLVFIKPLKEIYPKAKIHFMTSPRVVDLLDCVHGIDQKVIFEKRGKHKGFKGLICIHQQLKNEKYDLIIVLINTFRHVFLGIPHVLNFRQMSQKEFKFGGDHPLDINLNILRKLGIQQDEPAYDFNLEGEQNVVDDFLMKNGIEKGQPFIGFLPLAAWGLKNWPIDSWNQLAKRIHQEFNLKMVAFGKTSGNEIGKRVLERISPDIVSGINQFTLRQSIALLDKCLTFVSPDSSLLHFSSLLKVNTIGLYGPTCELQYYPYFHRNNVLRCKDIPAEFGCYHKSPNCTCRVGIEPAYCMTHLTVDEVFEKVRKAVKRESD